jgi:class 3 adenylate cyclase
MPNLPTGTVTFAFSDIEGSTALLKRLGDARYADLLATHRRLVRETFAAFGGQEIDTQGDAFFYSFPRARDAVAAAVAVQRAHADGKWPDEVAVRLRIGLHTGEPAIGEEGYTGLDVVRASRIAATGLGGQVLLSDTTRAIVADDLPDGVQLRSLGERTLRDIDRPEPLCELVIDGVEVSRPADEAWRRAFDRDVDASPGAADAVRDAMEGDLARDPDIGAAFPAGLPPGLPSWVAGTARRLIPGPDRTRDLIESRVLEALNDAFERRRASRPADARHRGPGGTDGPSDVPGASDLPGPRDPATSRPSTSVADEIDRLRALRDAGALTPAQYARAVDRVVGSDGADPAGR